MEETARDGPPPGAPKPPRSPPRALVRWKAALGNLEGESRLPQPARRASPSEPAGARPQGRPPVTCLSRAPGAGGQPRRTIVTWLILPVVICLSQRLSHACLSISNYTAKLRMAHYISYRLFDSTLLLG